MSKATPPTTSTNLDATKLIVAEYESLRSEIITRIGTGQNLVSLTLVVTGAFLGAGLQPQVNTSVLLVYPILAFFLAAGWAHNFLRIRQLADYIRQIESKVSVIGWSLHILDLSERTVSRVLGLLSASGVFVATQLIVILLAILQISFTTTEWILLAIDLLFVIGTILILSMSRVWQQLQRRLTTQKSA